MARHEILQSGPAWPFRIAAAGVFLACVTSDSAVAAYVENMQVVVISRRNLLLMMNSRRY
jgi:hypothetical protein